MKTVRLGMIGAGVIGATHSAVLQQIHQAVPDSLDLVAIADPVDRTRNMIGDLYDYRYRYADGFELIEKSPVDAVFICTPTAFHADLAKAAAARGLALFCEKPLAMDCSEAQDIADAVTRAGIPTQIGLVLRYAAPFTVIRDLLHDPRAGQPMAVIFRDDQVFPIRGVHFSAWRADPTLTAGGTLIEHGVHDLDILQWLFGPAIRLRAWEQNHAGHPGIEDYMAVELEFVSGLRAQLVNVWHNMVQRPSNRRLEIFCENAFIACEGDFNADIICQYGDGPQEVVPALEVLRRFLEHHPNAPPGLADLYGIAYLVQDYEFIRSLRHGTPTHPSIQIGVEAQLLAAATYHAARTGDEVDLIQFRKTLQTDVHGAG